MSIRPAFRRGAFRLGMSAMGVAALLGTGATATAAAGEDALVVALGASSTAGKGVGPGQTYPAQLEAMLRAEGRRVRVVDAGIDGDTSAGMLARLDADVPDGTRLVILQAGTNDAGAPGHDDTIAEIVARLRARSIRVVLFRTALMRDLRDGHAQADGHHLTPDGYRILASRLLPLVDRAIGR